MNSATNYLPNVDFNESETRDFILPPSSSLSNKTGAQLVEFMITLLPPHTVLQCLGLSYDPNYGYYPLIPGQQESQLPGIGNQFGSYNGHMYGLQSPIYNSNGDLATIVPEFPNLNNVVRDYSTDCYAHFGRSYRKKNKKPRKVAVRSIKRRRNTKS